MQTIGERLEEARKRQGISLREAADATKIRGEFLDAMENDSMEIPLQEVYRRGFLINYSKFLKIDPVKILTDYDALQMGRSKSSKHGRGEYLGHMELPEKEVLTDAPDLSTRNYQKTKSEAVDWEPYLKAALFFGGVVLVIAILVLIVRLILPGSSPQVNPELQESGSATGTATGSELAAIAEEEITLIALDDVTVTVTQISDSRLLFTGTLAKGETKTVKKRGAVRIGYTEGDYLLLQEGEQKYKIGKPGVGTITRE